LAATVEDLEKRLAQMEQELARLRLLVEKSARAETPAERGARLLAQARRDKSRLKGLIAKVFEEMGIQGEPVSPEKLRELMAHEGVRPEDRLFSRGIIEMREE
jgi:hypothetical protein